MLDREIVLTGIYPDKAAPKPATRKARVQGQRPIDQPDHRADILAELSQRNGGVGEDARVVLPHLERLAGKVGALPAMRLRLRSPH